MYLLKHMTHMTLGRRLLEARELVPDFRGTKVHDLQYNLTHTDDRPKITAYADYETNREYWYDHAGCICTISFCLQEDFSKKRCQEDFSKKRCHGLWLMVFPCISHEFTVVDSDQCDTFLHKLTCPPFSRSKSENKNFKAYKRPATESQKITSSDIVTQNFGLTRWCFNHIISLSQLVEFLNFLGPRVAKVARSFKKNVRTPSNPWKSLEIAVGIAMIANIG